MQELKDEEAILDLSDVTQVQTPPVLDAEEEESSVETVGWTTAEGIILPRVEVKVPNIATFPVYEEVLRTICKEVTEEEARSDEFRSHVGYMCNAIYNKKRPGIGLASNQIGLPLRVVVVDPDWPNTSTPNPKVLLNPVVASTEGIQKSREGCLSVPLEYRNVVLRGYEIVIRCLTLDWEPIEFASTGFEAAVLQHELDHLNGILFIDRLSKLKQHMYTKKLIKYAKRQYYAHKRAGTL
jgi:peptide deformylase